MGGWLASSAKEKEAACNYLTRARGGSRDSAINLVYTTMFIVLFSSCGFFPLWSCVRAPSTVNMAVS